jgi:hypothetical protein
LLLILVAPGLIAFGKLSFLEAQWRRTFGGVLSEYGVQLARAGWVCRRAAGRTRAVAAAMAGKCLSWP